MQPQVLVDYEFVVSTNSYTVRALLKLEGRPPEGGKRIPLNLALVLDRSGSMSGEKIRAARDAGALLVRRLFPEDTVSVVAFDDAVLTVARPATGSEQQGLPRLIEGIQCGGSTNLSGGWLQGREYVAANRREEASNRILLLTDGQANTGITDPNALVGLCAGARERGITTTTIGFGSDYDEHLLRRMAEAGGGNTYYIETAEQAPGVFEEEIEGLLSLSAQNITAEVSPGADVALTAVHHLYPTTRTGNDIRVEMGDLYAREPKLLLVEFVVPGMKQAGEVEIARCTVVAQVLTADGGVERQEITFPIRHALDGKAHHEPEVQREMLLLGAAKAREAALEAQERRDYGSAQAHLREAWTKISSSGDQLDGSLMEELQDLQAMESRMSPAVFTAGDAKYLHQRSYDSRSSKRSSSQRISRSRWRGIQYLAGDASRPVGAGPKVLAVVCNDEGAWGKGFLMSVSARWPEVREQFRTWHEGGITAPPFELGEVLLVQVEPDLWVANLLVQHGTRWLNGEPPIRYVALEAALDRLGRARHAAGSVRSHAADRHRARRRFVGCGGADGGETGGRAGDPVFVYQLTGADARASS
jgi:Ca-activated chloride channel homolog